MDDNLNIYIYIEYFIFIEKFYFDLGQYFNIYVLLDIICTEY
jgi:hypothetical protein